MIKYRSIQLQISRRLH